MAAPEPVVLRLLEEGDAPGVLALFAEDDVAAAMTAAPRFKRDDDESDAARRFCRERGSAQNFAIVAGGSFVGLTQLIRLADSPANSAEFGIALLRAERGKGWACRALIQLCTLARDAGMKELTARCFSENANAMSFLQSNGFERPTKKRHTAPGAIVTFRKTLSEPERR